MEIGPNLTELIRYLAGIMLAAIIICALCNWPNFRRQCNCPCKTQSRKSSRPTPTEVNEK